MHDGNHDDGNRSDRLAENLTNHPDVEGYRD